jgi:DNA mismatch endonuclease, patch repair protein
MADIVDRQTRSRMMSGIKGKNTKPEILVRKYIHGVGLRFRLHDGSLPGRPDIVLPRYRTVIFVHGCFWHRHPGCQYAYTPKSNVEFWHTKLQGNVDRDKNIVATLRDRGWMVLTVWECQANKPEVLRRIVDEIKGTFS